MSLWRPRIHPRWEVGQSVSQIPVRVWKGILKGTVVMIASRSERRAADILGIPIIKLREWEQQEWLPWMKIGQIYQRIGDSWQER